MVLLTSQHIRIYELVKKYCSDEETAKKMAIEIINMLEEDEPKSH